MPSQPAHRRTEKAMRTKRDFHVNAGKTLDERTRFKGIMGEACHHGADIYRMNIKKQVIFKKTRSSKFEVDRLGTIKCHSCSASFDNFGLTL